MPIAIPNRSSQKMVWGCDFSNSTNISKSEGTIAGSLSYNSIKGALFNGSTNYISYFPNSLLSSSSITFNIEFWPDFAYNDGNTRYLISAYTTAVKMLIAKSAGSAIVVYIGNAVSVLASSVSLADIWKVNQRNVLTVACTTGNNKVWLNGTEIGSSNTAWTPIDYTTAVVGAYYYGSFLNGFAGYIKSVSVHNTLFNIQEANDIYNTSTFNFMNKADLWLDMKSSTDNGGKPIVLDKSRNGKHFYLGDGSTPSTMPTFLGPGFDFDGSTDYMLNSNAAGIYNNTSQTIAICFSPDFAWDDVNYFYLFNTDATDPYSIIKADSGNSNTLGILIGGYNVLTIDSAVYGPHWKKYGINVLIYSGISGNNNAWLNGVQISSAGNEIWVPYDSAAIYLGQFCTGVGRFDGKIFHVSTYGRRFPQIMTSTQIRELTEFLMWEYS